MTDYDKLRRKVIWYALGWIAIVILTTYCYGSILKDEYNGVMTSTVYFSFLRDYCFHINLMGDLINVTILEYTGLKFDQINEHIRNLIKNQRHKITRAWENRIYPHQDRFSKPLNSKCIMWITIHLYLELRKITREIDSIFGIQMTIKMACYFGWLTFDLRELLYPILTENYVKAKVMSIMLHTFCMFNHMFKFLLINYMCEIVTTKVKATADILNRLSYVTCDIEVREVISQFSLRIVHAPLRFYGIGLFQFGFKFLHGFIASVATVVVIILQAEVNKQKFI